MRYLILIPLFCLASIINAQEAASTGKNIHSDEESIQWTLSELEKDETTGFLTGVKNSSENLYLIFQTSDERAISKILAAGMSLSLKAKTKPKLNAKIDYPIESEASIRPIQSRTGNTNRDVQGLSTQQQRQKMMLERQNLLISTKLKGKLKGFQLTNGTVFIDDISTIEAKINMKPNNGQALYSYEVKIPLKELFKEEINWARISETDIAIKYLVKPVSSPANNSRAGAASRGGGRGGARAGGGRGSGGRSNSASGTSSSSDMSKSQTVKITYRLKQY